MHILSLLIGWLLDLLFGDPARLPHPVVAFGKWISFWEHRLNRGRCRKFKGALVAVGSILLAFFLTGLVLRLLCLPALCVRIPLSGGAFSPLALLFGVVLVFFFLAGHTLRKEVRDVFLALDRSLVEGRQQVARIVGRDTANLSPQEVRTAALETLAENLSDGVVAPLFWFALLGLPGMAAYKMVNTLDSMIGYRTERYRDFGCWAAHIDDIANYIPARLTALLILCSHLLLRFRPASSTPASAEDVAVASARRSPRQLLAFVLRFGPCHASPNSGWPEAALAACLDCQFGGTHDYFGQSVVKPLIGDHPRTLATSDLQLSLRLAFLSELFALLLVVALALLLVLPVI